MTAAITLLAVFFIVLGLPIYESIEKMRVRWSEEDACARIGRDQVRGVVERLVYPQFVQERNR